MVVMITELTHGEEVYKMVLISQDKTDYSDDREGKILVVGGYGGVGCTISERLSVEFPGRVIVAGRSLEKARQFSAELDQMVFPLELDIHNGEVAEGILDEVALVVMCVDQKETNFVEACIQRGIHYVDITAGDEFLLSVEGLDQEAKLSGSTIVLSVGLAPGLTNLLASYTKTKVEDADHIDIFIMLGFGEEHGEAAVRWTVGNLASEFWIQEGDELRKTRSFLESKETVFPDGLGRRKGYRFNFSDQHVIKRTLNLRSASTWLCFDSTLTTGLLAASARVGALRLLRQPWMQELMVNLMRSIRFGSDIFVIQARAYKDLGDELPTFESTIRGYGEGRGTGIVASRVVDLMCRNGFPSGVFHLEQVIEPETFLEGLEEEGFWWSG